jgi:hypothetical protein
LYQKAGTTGKSDKDYYVKWLYNDQPLELDTFCPKSLNYQCPYTNIIDFYESAQYDGDVDLVCANGERPGTSKIWILFLVLAILVIVGLGGFLLYKYMQNKRRLEQELHR